MNIYKIIVIITLLSGYRHRLLLVPKYAYTIYDPAVKRPEKIRKKKNWILQKC